MEKQRKQQKPRPKPEPDFDPGYKKPPLMVRLFLCAYGFGWMGLLFFTAMNSLYLGYIDYELGSLLLALTLGFYLIFKWLPRLL